MLSIALTLSLYVFHCIIVLHYIKSVFEDLKKQGCQYHPNIPRNLMDFTYCRGGLEHNEWRGGVYTHSFVHKQSQVTIIRPWAFFHPCFPLEKISIWCQTIGKTNAFHLSVSLCTPSLSAKMRARGPSCKGSAQGKAPSNEPSSAF